MSRPAALALTVLALGVTAPSTLAQEYCVACTGPDATYLCILASEPGVMARGSGGQLLCIKELAQSGGHASCSVSRSTGEPCIGEPRTVLLPAGVEPPPPPPIAEVPPQFGEEIYAEPLPEGEPGAEALEHVEEGPPETLEELAKSSGQSLKKAGEAVTDGAKNAGNAVGNAVKKTWDCVTSLFGEC